MKYFLERLLSKEKLKRKRNCYIEFTFTEQAEKHAKFARVSELEVCEVWEPSKAQMENVDGF